MNICEYDIWVVILNKGRILSKYFNLEIQKYEWKPPGQPRSKQSFGVIKQLKSLRMSYNYMVKRILVNVYGVITKYSKEIIDTEYICEDFH